MALPAAPRSLRAALGDAVSVPGVCAAGAAPEAVQSGDCNCACGLHSVSPPRCGADWAAAGTGSDPALFRERAPAADCAPGKDCVRLSAADYGVCGVAALSGGDACGAAGACHRKQH